VSLEGVVVAASQLGGMSLPLVRGARQNRQPRNGTFFAGGAGGDGKEAGGGGGGGYYGGGGGGAGVDGSGGGGGVSWVDLDSVYKKRLPNGKKPCARTPCLCVH
jgi:hypothetical protein